MQLFFLISGFVILMTALRATRPSDCAISRVSRLCPVYWIVLPLLLAALLGGGSRGVEPQFVATPVMMALNLLVVEWGPFFAAGMLAYLARPRRISDARRDRRTVAA